MSSCPLSVRQFDVGGIRECIPYVPLESVAEVVVTSADFVGDDYDVAAEGEDAGGRALTLPSPGGRGFGFTLPIRGGEWVGECFGDLFED